VFHCSQSLSKSQNIYSFSSAIVINEIMGSGQLLWIRYIPSRSSKCISRVPEQLRAYQVGTLLRIVKRLYKKWWCNLDDVEKRKIFCLWRPSHYFDWAMSTAWQSCTTRYTGFSNFDTTNMIARADQPRPVGSHAQLAQRRLMTTSRADSVASV
jgi:hypothetical protein